MIDQTDPWKHFRILRRVGIVSVLFFSLAAAFFVLGQIDMHSRGFHALTFGWMLVVLVMLAVTHEAKCPQCGQRFYAKGADFSQITKRCLHCGQEKYAELGARSIPE